jgi:hypothetical protein
VPNKKWQARQNNQSGEGSSFRRMPKSIKALAKTDIVGSQE